MATTKFDTRATVQKSALSRLAPTASPANRVELDNILASLDAAITPPLEMRASATPDLIVNIGSITVQDPENNYNNTIPPINNLLPNFTSGTVTFPSTSGSNATPSAGDPFQITISTNNFLKVGINMDANGNLILQSGAEGASLAAAANPPLVPNTFPIGFVVLQDVSGTIQAIEDEDIYQYLGGGGGGSGSGDASSVLTRMWDNLNDSIFDQLSGVDFSQDSDAHVDPASTGAYSLVSSTFEFASAAQTLVTSNLLSNEEFVNVGGEIGRISVVAFWEEEKIDPAATYEWSGDGGTSWNALTMSRVGNASDAFYGEAIASFPSNDSTHAGQTNIASSLSGDEEAHAEKITLTTQISVTELRLRFQSSGSPTGILTVSIFDDNAGEPGSSVAVANETLDASTLGAAAYYDFTFTDLILPAGDYWIHVEGDATYKANNLAIDRFLFRGNGAGDTYYKLVGSTWTEQVGRIYYNLQGIARELKLRVTSSDADVALLGYGLYYDPSGQFSSGEEFLDIKTFQSDSDSFSFDLNFMPDPDQLKVYYVEAGQVFSRGSFQVSGSTVTFPAGTFVQETDQGVTLRFEQGQGTIDRSEGNANAIAGLTANGLQVSDLSSGDLTIPVGITLKRPKLTIQAGHTYTVNGTLVVDDDLIVLGDLVVGPGGDVQVLDADNSDVHEITEYKSTRTNGDGFIAGGGSGVFIDIVGGSSSTPGITLPPGKYLMGYNVTLRAETGRVVVSRIRSESGSNVSGTHQSGFASNATETQNSMSATTLLTVGTTTSYKIVASANGAYAGNIWANATGAFDDEHDATIWAIRISD